MNERLVLGQLFEGFCPEEYGDFVPLRPGVEILPLYGIDQSGGAHSASGSSAAILRYAPGARVPRHEHPGYEHIIVLSGSQSDHEGKYVPGTCIVNPPGSSHAVVSEEGCVVLAIWERPVQFLDSTEPT